MNFLELKIKIAEYFIIKKQNKLQSKFNKIGKNVYISKGYDIQGYENINIQDNVWIGQNCKMAAMDEINIMRGCILSHNIEIWTSNHNYNSDDLQSIPYDARFEKKPVTICENVWIGSRVIILPGITIGEGAVIGAGAVVTKDIPPLAVVGGNPARVIKYRNKKNYYNLKNQDKIYLEENYDYNKSLERKK